MTKRPLVSVCVITYQHVSYIQKCLDSILIQKTDFDFEIILGEDGSIDGTKKICVDYASKYPNKIRLFLRERMDRFFFEKKLLPGRYNFVEGLKSAQGRYIALCDGDDFWTDPYKLQKQVDFLENNSNFVLVGHNADVIDGANIIGGKVKNVKEENINISTSDFLMRNPYITSMTMFRNIGFDNILNVLINFNIGDWPLFTLLSFNGSCCFFSESVGCYRIHDGNITSKNRIDYQQFKNEIVNRINHAEFWNNYSDNKYNLEVSLVKKKRSRSLVNIALKNGDYKTAIYYSQYIDIKELDKSVSKLMAVVLKIIFRIKKFSSN